jgi:hypothetical protein
MLPHDILKIIFDNTHYGDKYKFYLINKEIRNLFNGDSKKKHIGLACKIKFYNLINFTSNFNSWNKKRVKIIKDFCHEFDFKIAFLDEGHLVKSFQKYSLDFILYRGLTLESATALDCIKISDHNPIIANFEVFTN